MIADGVKRSEPMEDGGTVTYSSICVGDTLKVDTLMAVPQIGLSVKEEGVAKLTSTGYKFEGEAIVTYNGQTEIQILKTICNK